MKIAVVSYRELNKEPSASRVIEDVIDCAAHCDERTADEFGSELGQMLSELETKRDAGVIFVDTSDFSKRAELTVKLKEISPDLLVTYNLAGFELCTYTDGLSYNLVDCRQFHLKENRCLPNEEYLFKEKSINMFFFGI